MLQYKIMLQYLPVHMHTAVHISTENISVTSNFYACMWTALDLSVFSRFSTLSAFIIQLYMQTKGLPCEDWQCTGLCGQTFPRLDGPKSNWKVRPINKIHGQVNAGRLLHWNYLYNLTYEPRSVDGLFDTWKSRIVQWQLLGLCYLQTHSMIMWMYHSNSHSLCIA